MANDLTFDQVSAVLTEVVAQATGTRPITPVDTSSFVTVGQLALKVGYDPLVTAISQTLSKTIFSIRPYNAKFKMINVDSVRYGNHVRKLQTLDSPMEDDQRFDLVDGQSIDHYVVKKPKVVQTNFYGAEIFQRHLTRFKDQLDNALTGPDQFGSFITMIMTNASDQIEQAKESMSRMALNNLTASTFLAGRPEQKQNVLALYNDWAGTSFTTSTVFNPENFTNFARWLYGHVNSVSDFLTERSAAFHQPIGPNTIMRHTPKQDQRLYLNSQFSRYMESVATSTTFHDNKTVFPPHEFVNYWQSISDPYHVNVTPSLLDATGNATTGEETEIPYLVGVLFDRETIGTTQVNEWSSMTPLNAAGGYWNLYWHFTIRWWNDFSENAVVFYMADE